MASIYLTQNEWFQSPALGDVDMGGNTIENLAAPVDASDAVTKQYADSLAGGINPSQWSMFPAVSDVNMNISTITNLKTPVNISDAVNKGYCDSTASTTAYTASALWAASPASQDVNMNVSSIYNVKQISNSAGLVLSGTDNYADTNHRITVATSGITVNSVNLTGNVSINSGYNTTIAANTNGAQTSGVITLSNKTNSAYLTSSGFGLGVNNPTAKFEIMQDAAADCMRVYDSNADTTYFKIDANGYVGVNTGNNGTATKALNIGYGSSDSNSALKFNSGANDKIYWTFYDTGPKTSILNDFVKQDDLGSLGHPNYGSQIWRTMGASDYIERMRLTNTGNLGLGTSTPTAKLEILQDAATDAMRVLDSNADTTYFKVDSEGRVGINCGSSGTSTKALNIGYGVSDSTSALKFNSSDGDKLFLTYLDAGSRVSQLSNWGFQCTAGIDTGVANNQGFFSWRTGGVAAFVERLRLENNGQLNTMNNKIINVGTPTTGTDAANKSYVDSISGSNSAGWSLNPATSNINAASYKIINLGSAVNAGDAVNKAYLDSNYFNPKGGNCYYVEASIDSPGTDYTVDLGSSPFNDIYVNVCLKTGYTKNIYWTNNNNTNLQGRRVHVSVSGTSDAAASGKCYYLDGSGSYYDISLNSSNRILVFVFLKGYTGLNDLVLESSRAS